MDNAAGITGIVPGDAALWRRCVTSGLRGRHRQTVARGKFPCDPTYGILLKLYSYRPTKTRSFVALLLRMTGDKTTKTAVSGGSILQSKI